MSDNTTKERHLSGVGLLYNMYPINAQNKTAIKPQFFGATAPIGPGPPHSRGF
jgi:hypothetical protein